MDIGNQVLESMEIVRETPPMYNGGITASINAIVWFSRRYLDNPYRGYKSSVDLSLNQIKKLYKTIPFDRIKGVAELSSLSSIKDLLSEFEIYINYIFKDHKREAILSLTQIASAIVSYEKQYFENLDLLFAGFAETI